MFFSLASACSYIAAVSFKLEAYFRMDLHQVASASKLCQWKRSRQQVAPAFDDDNSAEDNFRSSFTPKRLTHEQETKFKDLKLLVPGSSIFTSLVDEE